MILWREKSKIRLGIGCARVDHVLRPTSLVALSLVVGLSLGIGPQVRAADRQVPSVSQQGVDRLTQPGSGGAVTASSPVSD